MIERSLTEASIQAAEREFGVTIGVTAWRTDQPEDPIRISGDVKVTAASTIKLFILAALLASDQYDEELTLHEVDQVGGSGVLNSLTPGRPWAVRDLATLMMIVSDNTATNMLIDLLGVETLNQFIQEHGWANTTLTGKLMQPGRRVSSKTTPDDLADCMARLWGGELLPEVETKEARRILKAQHYTDALGREIDFDAFGEGSGVTIASKSGSVVGIRNDVALISHSGKEYVVAIMTSGCEDPRFWPDNPGLLAIARVNRLLFERFLR